MIKYSAVNKKAHEVTYAQALQAGYLRETVPTKEELEIIEKELIPASAKLQGLRFPEKHAKTEEDFMRLSYIEEDKKWLEEQKLMELTRKEQKKLPREVLADDWQEDMSIYKHKRRP